MQPADATTFASTNIINKKKDVVQNLDMTFETVSD